MSRIPEQLRRLIEEHGQSEKVPQAQVDALLAGRGRVEFLEQLADEYGVELKLEKRPRKRDEKVER